MKLDLQEKILVNILRTFNIRPGAILALLYDETNDCTESIEPVLDILSDAIVRCYIADIMNDHVTIDDVLKIYGIKPRLKTIYKYI